MDDNDCWNFAIFKSDKGNYYIYSVAAQKFVGDPASNGTVAVPLLDNPNANMTIEAKSTQNGYTFMISPDAGASALNLAQTTNCYGVISWLDGYSKTADPGNVFNFIESGTLDTEILSTLTTKVNNFEDKAIVTFKYYIGSKDDNNLYKEVETEHLKDVAVNVPEQRFVKVISVSKTDNVTEDCTVDVICEEDLPFVKSNDFSTAVWNVVDMHSNAKPYTWKYNTETEEVNTEEVNKAQPTALGDEYYWAFVGDLVSGFKIYNKKAGAGMTLRKEAYGNSGVSKMSAGTDNNVFHIFDADESTITNATCFKIEGDNAYLNEQIQSDGTRKLLGWEHTDEGSSCRFFSPASFLINYVDNNDLTTKAPVGAVGGFIWLETEGNVEKITEAITSVRANEYDLNALDALSEFTTQAANAGRNSTTFEDGGFYRIQNVLPSNPGNKYMVSADENGRLCDFVRNDKASYIWKLCAVEGETGGYKLYSPNWKGYMNAATNNALNPDYDGAGMYKFTSFGGAQYNIKDGNNTAIVRLSTDGGKKPDRTGTRISTWTPSKGGDGAWFFIPATELEVALHEAKGAFYATTYLPFAASVKSGATAYTGTMDGTMLKAKAVAGAFPAETGVILKSDEAAEKAVLAIGGDVEGDFDKGILEGTLTGKVYEDELTFGLSDTDDGGELGFFHYTGGTTLDANKAFLPAPAEGVKGFVLDFGGAVTGIEGLNPSSTNAGVLYDLSGRRVQKAVKGGIYLQNGKKFIAQ